MAERDPVTPDDLIICGETARETLKVVSDDLWSRNPPNMTWSRLVIASHICGALLSYATQLASGSPAYTQTIRQDESVITGENLPELIMSQSALLAAVARGVPPGTRAWHSAGSPDAEGYLAMGCAEVLLHCWDAAAATEVKISGDEMISDRILRRLFPWAPTDTPRWQTLLFATNREDLQDRSRPGEDWMWHNAPLEEWDGKEVRHSRWIGR